MSTLSIIEKLGIKLIQTSPFYASLVSSFRKIETNEIPTEGVAIKNGRIEFYYNPKFLETLTVDEAVAVLTHECVHLILGHCTRMRDEYKENPTLANISQDMNCVSPDTFLIGPNKRIDEVKKGEFVLGTGGYRVRINEVFKRNYKGDLLQVKASSVLPFKVTPEHPLLIVKRKYKKSRHPIELSEKKWVKASELEKDDYLIIPKIKYDDYITELDLSRFVNPNPLLRNNIKGPLKNLRLNLTEELAWILGFYVADGSNNMKGGLGLNFSLHPTEIHYARKIQKFFRQFGYTSRLINGLPQSNPAFTGKMGMKISVNSSILGRAFQEWCGHGAVNKHIPNFILYHKNLNLVKAFLKGYFDGDGCYSTNKEGLKRATATSISELLIQQCQLAVQRLGNNNWAAIGKVKKNNGVGKKQQYFISWYVPKVQYRNLNGKKVKMWGNFWKEFDNYFLVPVSDIERIPYKGLVYNLETSDHTFCVNNIVTHNCNRNIQNLPYGACTVDSITKEFAQKGIKLNLKPDDTSENYYKELNKHSNKMKITADGEGGFDIEIKDPNGKSLGKIKVKAVCSNKKDSDPEGKGEQDIPELAKEVIRQAIKNAVDSQKQQGHLPAGLEEAINEWLKPPVIPWNQVLKSFIVNNIKSGKRNSWKRPNRRFGETQKGKLPVRMPAITVCFDTSGSMSEEDLQLGIAELNGIRRIYKADITVLEGDADIQKEYKLTKYSKPQLNFKGRGGTSFVPAFEYIKEKKIKTDVMIYFTDMYGDFPKKAPSYPTIWVSTSDCKEAPWGRVLSIKDHPAYKDKK